MSEDQIWVASAVAQSGTGRPVQGWNIRLCPGQLTRHRVHCVFPATPERAAHLTGHGYSDPEAPSVGVRELNGRTYVTYDPQQSERGFADSVFWYESGKRALNLKRHVVAAELKDELWEIGKIVQQIQDCP